jgi:hypothetical protein
MSERKAFEAWFKFRYPLHEASGIYGAIAWDAWQAGSRHGGLLETDDQKPDHSPETALILLCQIRCNGMPGGLMP